MDSAQRERKGLRQIFREHLVEYLLIIAVALIGKFGTSPIEHYVTQACIAAVRVIGLYGTHSGLPQLTGSKVNLEIVKP